MHTTAPETGGGRAAATRVNPFLGLEYYTEQDRDWFFGRTRERRIIIGQLRTSRLTVLYAESGVGKSSLLRAGVSAHLRDVALRHVAEGESPIFIPLVFNDWKDDPLNDLIAKIEREAQLYANAARENTAEDESGSDPPGDPALPAPAAKLSDGFETTPENGLAATINRAASELDATFLIILDQFEECFSYQNKPERLAAELASCVNRPDVRANFLIAIREDAYGRIGDLFRARIGNVYGNYLHLEYLREDAAREAIKAPVDLYSRRLANETIEVEPKLIDAVLTAVRRDSNLDLGKGRQRPESEPTEIGDGEIEAPFLQLVMDRVWQRERIEPPPEKRSPLLRKSTLDELGGAEEIVRGHLIRALDGLSPAQLETAAALFSLLVTPSGAKIAHTAEDLAKITKHPDDVVATVLDKLRDERIVRAQDPAPGGKNTRYELFHDKLAGPVLEWRDQQERILAKREAEKQRRHARNFRNLAIAAGVLAIVAIIAFFAAWQSQKAATSAKHDAQREAATATWIALYSSAQLARDSPPQVPLSLALAAYRFRPEAPAASSMIATLEAFRDSRALAVLHGTPDTVNAVAFAPSGEILASGGGDGAVRLWNVRARRQIGNPLQSSHSAGVVGVTFSPNGRTVASAGGYDPTVRLWDVRSHGPIRSIRADSGRNAYVYTVAFDPSGTVLASASANQGLALWNVQTGNRIGPPFACLDCKKVTSVAFSPSGALLASGGYDHSVRLWNARTHRQIARMNSHTGTIYAVAFSPDGRTVASAATDGTIRLWRVRTHSQLVPPLRVSSRPVANLAFRRDGELAASDADGKVTLWNVRTHHELGAPLAADTGTVLGVAFSRDGHTLASSGTNGTIVLWNARHLSRLGGVLTRHRSDVETVATSTDTIASGSAGGTIRLSDPLTRRTTAILTQPGGGGVRGLTFSPDGQTLASVGDNRAVTLWNVQRRAGAAVQANAQRLIGRVLVHDRSPLRTIAASPDGRTLAWADRNTITVWNAHAHGIVAHLSPGQGVIESLAFSRAGLLASAGGSGTLVVWNPYTKAPEGRYDLSQSSLRSVAFSPDGQELAAGGDDKRIHLWSVGGHRQVGTLLAAPGGVLSVAFSPDGRILASGGSDDTVRIWDARSHLQLGPPLSKHESIVNSVAFTPDGNLLVSGSSDRTVRVWQGIFWHNLRGLEREVCGTIGTGLGPAEWSRYQPGIEYQRSCPGP